MTLTRSLRQTTKLSTIAIFAAGMAAAPVALSGSFDLTTKNAFAQAGDNGQAEDFVSGADRGVEESALDTNVMQILGTTHKELQAEVDDTPNTRAGVFGEYSEALSDSNLQRAAEVLALASNRPITHQMVVRLNTALGVETNLSAGQIADAALRRQSARKEMQDDIKTHGDFTFDTHSPAFRAYETAMRAGNLDAAGEALAGAFHRPITEALVLYVNRDLGFESNLTTHQVASAAAEAQSDLY